MNSTEDISFIDTMITLFQQNPERYTDDPVVYAAAMDIFHRMRAAAIS